VEADQQDLAADGGGDDVPGGGDVARLRRGFPLMASI
jgi:hypothetical protein